MRAQVFHERAIGRVAIPPREAGALPPPMVKQLPQLLFNDQVNAALTALFLLLTWVLVLDTARVCFRALRGLSTPPFTEVPYVQTQLAH